MNFEEEDFSGAISVLEEEYVHAMYVFLQEYMNHGENESDYRGIALGLEIAMERLGLSEDEIEDMRHRIIVTYLKE